MDKIREISGLIPMLADELSVDEKSIVKALRLELAENYNMRLTESNKKYTDEELLEDWKAKVCEKGRVPTWPEVDEDFMMAASNTYNRRFGTKEKINKLCGIKELGKGVGLNE